MSAAIKKTSQLITIEKAMKDLPSLPIVVMKIMQLTGDDNSRSEQVEQLIKNDQAISAKVLRVVNSPYFGMSGEISTLSQAVLVLGYDHIRNIVLSLGTDKVFTSQNEAVKQIHLQLWKHAIGTAATAEFIAIKKGLDKKEAEFLFSCGLLTNIGALFFAGQYVKPYGMIFSKLPQENAPLSYLEERSFGCNHADVAEILAQSWKFPEDLTSVLSRHEGPFAEGDPKGWLVVHIADQLAANAVFHPERQFDPANLDPIAAAWLGYSEAEFAAILQHTNKKLEEANDLLAAFG
jgi:HD-like signal output (HDOD) protein